MTSHARWVSPLGVLIAWLAIPAQASPQSQPAPGSLKANLLELGAQGQDPFAGEQVEALATLVALEVSTAPMGTSSGAFTYTWDGTLGTFRRSASSFGPAFAERSLTIGKRKLAFGLNWLHASYDSLAGANLSNEELHTARNIRVLGLPFSDATMVSNISSDTAVAFASYGIADDLEIAVTVPWVRVSMDATISSYAGLTKLATLTMSRETSTGIGDLALSGKYHFWHHEGGGLSAGVELRLPTGDTDELRGLGVTRTLVSGIWSRGGTVSPHVNVGYEFWSDELTLSPAREVFARNQVRYAAGFEWTPHPRITSSFDLVGRRQLRGGALEHLTIVNPFGSADPLIPVSRGIDVVSFAAGGKWNIGGNLLLSTNVLRSLKNEGLRANWIPAIGLDWSF